LKDDFAGKEFFLKHAATFLCDVPVPEPSPVKKILIIRGIEMLCIFKFEYIMTSFGHQGMDPGVKNRILMSKSGSGCEELAQDGKKGSGQARNQCCQILVCAILLKSRGKFVLKAAKY
jgi:hypothetical protein